MSVLRRPQGDVEIHHGHGSANHTKVIIAPTWRTARSFPLAKVHTRDRLILTSTDERNFWYAVVEVSNLLKDIPIHKSVGGITLLLLLVTRPWG